jgi:hypothetical protein
MRAAILEATVPEHATAIADEHEVLVLLSEAARGGSVSAMKALLAFHRGRGRQPEVGREVCDELDELAHRRRPPVRDGAWDGRIRNRSGNRYKPSALRSYERALRLRVLPVLGGYRIGEIRRRDVQDLVEDLTAEGLSPARSATRSTRSGRCSGGP